MFEVLIEAYRWFFLRLADVVGLGWGIVALSFITSAAMMPLMRAVAGVVRRETDYQSVILPQLAEIKRRYASDIERNFRIQRLYARYAYSPLSAVKKVLPLFVQIPFLLLTYYMLKGTPQLDGVSFLFLKDLGRPDGLLKILDVNVLPFVMTGINLLTVAATHDFTRKDQFQATGISLLFLALLYTAPSALLLYWTLNNAITMFRTLFAKRGEGARLLAGRVFVLRRLPKFACGMITPVTTAYFGLVLLIVALYMRLVVFMEIWWFNYMASYWLMGLVLAIAMWATFLALRPTARWCRIVWKSALTLATFFALGLLGSICSVVITFKALMFITSNVNLALVFDILLALWIVAVGSTVWKDWRAALRDILSALRENAIWFLLPVILAIHYSYSSANFKLPLASLAVLVAYLTIPIAMIAVVLTWAFRRILPSGLVFKIILGACIGVYLVPMVSLESGKLLGYGSNIVIRFALMGGVAYLISRVKNRKPATIFLSVLGLVVLVDSALSRYRLTEETSSQACATSGSEARQALLNAPGIHTNSIFLLVYDGYAPDAILDGMKIKSIGLRKYLSSRGFTSYDCYSVGNDTVVSMGNAFYIGGVVQGSVRSSMAGNNVFCDYLRRFGYRTLYVLSGYDMPRRGERMPGDFYFPPAQKVTRPEMVLYPCIMRGILSQVADTFNDFTREEWLSAKYASLATTGPSESFFYSHSSFPGHVIANPIYRKSPEEERLAYERRVAEADIEMQRDVDLLLARNDDSIIIVASDHGSHLTLPDNIGEYDAFTMLDRVGVQLHVRWPRDYKPCLDLTCFQNLFLEIEIYLSGDRSLARFALPGESLRIMAPLRAPAGTIINGIIQSGPDKGRNLFEAARERASKY